MPAVSDKQRRFMQMVAAGKIKRKGLSKDEARKFATTKGPLPERVKNGKPVDRAKLLAAYRKKKAAK